MICSTTDSKTNIDQPLRRAIYRRTLATGFLVALFIVSAAELQAQIITAFDGASGPGLDSISFNSIVSPAGFNDDVVGSSPNIVLIDEMVYNAVDYIDLVFEVLDFGAFDAEYEFQEGIFNGTGIPWTDYHIQLGYGTGTGFVPSTPGDGLDFDAPHYNSPVSFAPFANIVVVEDEINVDDGIILPGEFYVFSFAVDVPISISSFTVRQYPTVVVPEPTSLLLAMLGIAGLLFRRAERLAPKHSRACDQSGQRP